MDENESPENAALREIEEETGAKQLVIKEKLAATYHIYNNYGEDVLKITHWFHLNSHCDQILIPQTEEDITAIKWFSQNELDLPLSNTFPTISDLIEVYLNKIN